MTGMKVNNQVLKIKVNEQMILLYLEVGKFLYELIENISYGDKIITKTAYFMKTNYPSIKGFTERNIERMVQFYRTYKDDEVATPLVTQLSWTNNLLILSGAKFIKMNLYYEPSFLFAMNRYYRLFICLFQCKFVALQI